jgi:Beta-lactamase
MWTPAVFGGDEQRLADLPVRPAPGGQCQHLGLRHHEAERGRLAKEREAQPRNPAVLAWAPVAAPSSSPVPGSPRSEVSPSQPTVSHTTGSGERPVSASVGSSCWQGGAAGEDRVVGPVDLGGVGWAARATLRDLLANRSQLPLRAAVEFESFQGDADDVRSRFAATIATAASSATAPFWSYTNAGWCLLGRAIETLTGRTWEQAMGAQLLAPLAMDQTTFTNRAVAEPRAVGHQPTPTAPSRSSPGPRDPTARQAARCCRPWMTCCGSPAATSGIPPWPSCGLPMHRSGSTHGWMPGAWDGHGSTGRAVRCGDGRPDQRQPRDPAAAAPAPRRRGAAHQRQHRTGPVPVAVPDPAGGLVRRRNAGAAAGAPPGAAGDLGRFAGVYAWPDRRWEVTASDTHLVMEGDGGTIEAQPLDDHTFVVDAEDPDVPTVTFGGFGASGRPAVLYQMLWGLPRV